MGRRPAEFPDIGGSALWYSVFLSFRSASRRRVIIQRCPSVFFFPFKEPLGDRKWRSVGARNKEVGGANGNCHEERRGGGGCPPDSFRYRLGAKHKVFLACRNTAASGARSRRRIRNLRKRSGKFRRREAVAPLVAQTLRFQSWPRGPVWALQRTNCESAALTSGI